MGALRYLIVNIEPQTHAPSRILVKCSQILVSSKKVISVMKNNHWLSFVSGALIGAGITWLLTSGEGKEVVDKVTAKGKDLKDKITAELDGLNEQLNDWSNKHKTS
jgi:hypothetical protein